MYQIFQHFLLFYFLPLDIIICYFHIFSVIISCPDISDISTVLRRRRASSCSDLESVNTEDFESQYLAVVYKPSSSQQQTAKPRLGTQPQLTLNGRTQHNQSMKNAPVEDQESVKKIAMIPITKFDRFLVDSDVDTICSQVVRDKLSQDSCESNLLNAQESVQHVEKKAYRNAIYHTSKC